MKRLTYFVILFILLISTLFLCGFKSDDKTVVTLNYGNYKLIYEDKPITPTNHVVSEQIYYRKINASLEEKLKVVEQCLYAGSDFKNAVLYCFPLLKNVVNKAISDIECDPVDSKIIFNPDGYKYFTIIKEKAGKRIDEEALYSTIYFGLKKSSNPKINITTVPIEASITAEDNKKLTYLRAEYSTDYSSSGENRKHNIRLALSKINGTVLKSGEEFSFNSIVGARNEKFGFRKARIIVKGKYIDGYGGGVCQASTTVYNCALRADMKITMVNNHSLMPSYVSPSFDAMVNSGSSDLKFVNDGKDPIFIRCYGTDSKAVVEIYGTEMPYVIKTESEMIYQKDPVGDKEIIDTEYTYIEKDAESGSKKRIWYSKGECKSKGYLIYCDYSGNIIDRKLIRSDVYSAAYGLIAIAP